MNTTTRPPAQLKRISWGAIFAGAVVAVVVGLMLNLLGLGIGLSTFDFGPSDTAKGFGIAQAVWFTISSLLSLFAGGWVAGHLAGIPRKIDGMLHGLVAWGLTTLLTVYLVSSGVGAILGGVTSVVGSGLSAAGSGIAAAAPGAVDAAQRELDQRGITLGTVRQQAESLLRDTGDPNLQPEALEGQANAAADDAQAGAEQAAQNPQTTDFRAAFDRVFDRAEGVASEADKQDLVNILVARTDMNEAQARQTIDQYQTTIQQARAQADTLGQQATAAAETATNAVGTGAIAAFVALLLGAIAAAVGGGLGAKREFMEPYPDGYLEARTPAVTVYDDKA